MNESYRSAIFLKISGGEFQRTQIWIFLPNRNFSSNSRRRKKKKKERNNTERRIVELIIIFITVKHFKNRLFSSVRRDDKNNPKAHVKTYFPNYNNGLYNRSPFRATVNHNFEISWSRHVSYRLHPLIFWVSSRTTPTFSFNYLIKSPNFGSPIALEKDALFYFQCREWRLRNFLLQVNNNLFTYITSL